MYDHVEQGILSIDEFLAGLRSLETYLVRRFLAKESTNYLNKIFPVLSRDIDLKNFDASLKKSLMSRSFPSDSRLRQSAENVELYNKSRYTREKLALIFSTINKHLSAEDGAFTQLDDEPTVEHIMPQTLTEAWRQHIGKDWEQDYELLHTLGSLTLVTQEWNSSMSNNIFATKKKKLARHGLLLNSAYFSGEYDTWDGYAIRERAQWLVAKVNEIWPMLGELQESSGRTEKPKGLTILGESYTVESWRDVLHSTAECVVQWRASDFEKVAEEISQYIKQEKFEGTCRQLSNGC
ncbi:MAG: HNH endonuclease family protein [Chloroflexota bacterium]